jgi:predicted Zn-dependent protease
MNKWQRMWMVLILAAIIPSCATNPVSKNKEFVMMSEKEELNLGQKLAAEYNKQLPLLDKKDPLAVYVNRVGQKVANVSDRPNLFFEFNVVDDATINAFALPGGHIYIHRGLLNHLNAEAELAAVLSHEVGHVTARHAVARYTQIQGYQLGMMITSIFVPIPQALGQITSLMAQSFIMGFGRKQELESDELALKYAPQAGYDPQATVHLLATLKRLEDISKLEKKDVGDKVPEYHGAFASHPETKKRILEAEQQALMVHPGGVVGHDAMLQAVAGYPYGDSPKDGAVIGQRFVHPDLAIQLQFPERWAIKNQAEALTARVRKEKVFFMLTMKKLSKRANATEVLQSLYEKRHIGTVTTGTLAGLPYARARVQASAPKVSKAWIDVTVRLDGPDAMIMSMWCPRDEIDQFSPDFNQIFQSFARYNSKEGHDVPRIALYHWQAGDSWKLLADRSKAMLGRFTAEKLAALNGMDVTEQPANNHLIKIVR